jgi:hypothetical protein
MFAAFDWNEVLMKAQMGAVLGGVGGACAGLVAYLSRKPDERPRFEPEPPRRARPRAEAGAAKTTSRAALVVATLALVAAGTVVVNPSLVAPLVGIDRKPSATISDYGRYREKGSIRVVPDLNEPSDVTVVGSSDLAFLEQTDRIPCRVGETWGMRVRVADAPTDRPYTVRKEVHHPPFRQPDGSVRTKSGREFKLQPGPLPDLFSGWYFLKGYEYELVTGEWTLVVFIDDVEVARKAFNVQK